MIDVVTTVDFAALAARVATLEAAKAPPGTVAVPSDSSGVRAQRIADFLDQRTGFNWFPVANAADNNPWGAYPGDNSLASAIAAYKDLYPVGCGHTPLTRIYHFAGREAVTLPWCQKLAAATGTRVCVALGANASAADVPSLAAMALDSANGTGWCYAIEGINEANNNFGVGNVPVATTIAAQQAIWNAARATDKLAHPVLAYSPSLVFGLPVPEGYITTGYINAADLATLQSLADVGNLHIYPPDEIDMDDGSGRGGIMNDIVLGMSRIWPSKPLTDTEWHPSLYDMHRDATGNFDRRLDPTRDPYVMLCQMLSMYRAKLREWHWFCCVDYGTAFLSGMFPNTGGASPRPVATSLHALNTLAPDVGAAKHIFTPGMLDYTITGGPAPLPGLPNSGLQSLLFQGSDGPFYLAVWNAQSAAGGAVAPVTVKFVQHGVASVKDYRISAVSGPDVPVQALLNVTSVTMSMAAEVRLLVIHV